MTFDPDIADDLTLVDGVEVAEDRYGRVQRRRVRVVRDDTYAELESAVFPTARLIEIAKTLRPMETGETTSSPPETA